MGPNLNLSCHSVKLDGTPIAFKASKTLMELVDEIVAKGIYVNRSDFIRDAIRLRVESVFAIYGAGFNAERGK